MNFVPTTSWPPPICQDFNIKEALLQLFPPPLPALTGRTRQFERCSNSRVRPVVGQALSDRSICRRVGQACPISSWDRLHRTSQDRSDKSVRPVGSRFGRTVSVRPPVEHGCSSTARAAVFDRLMPAVPLPHQILGSHHFTHHPQILFTIPHSIITLVTPHYKPPNMRFEGINIIIYP
ncbi:hypothetical protein PCANC_12272 [Puccinia coronata f. sp. avenae]|uniref:Uncharacterized protein n=1 Tax=Puccinia coronata f. sp. avenae TaxID=200324 RepID=A0A2N5SZ29_9BASI|nr:hypothetical protein PCANC_12272 [Puccinia coronata f. sp. avenae]